MTNLPMNKLATRRADIAGTRAEALAAAWKLLALEPTEENRRTVKNLTIDLNRDFQVVDASIIGSQYMARALADSSVITPIGDGA